MTDTTPLAIDWDAVTQRFQQWEAGAATLIAGNKTTLLSFLSAAGITRVMVNFDGCGDSGQIEDVAAFKGDDQVDIPSETVELLTLNYGATEPAAQTFSADDAIEKLAYDLSIRSIAAGKITTAPMASSRSTCRPGRSRSTITSGSPRPKTTCTNGEEAMMGHCYHHALSSVRKWGGQPEDYLALHQWFDEPSKLIIADFRHRALRHHAEGIFMLERFFGATITVSTGRVVPVRFIGEQHVREDLGFIPSFADWVRCIRPDPWMGRAQPIHRDVDPFALPAHAEMETI